MPPLPPIQASAILEGDAETMVVALQGMRGSSINKQVTLTIRIKNRAFGGTDNYRLPVIADGNFAAAHDTVEKVYRQGLITPEQQADLLMRIEHIATLTR